MTSRPKEVSQSPAEENNHDLEKDRWQQVAEAAEFYLTDRSRKTLSWEEMRKLPESSQKILDGFRAEIAQAVYKNDLKTILAAFEAILQLIGSRTEANLKLFRSITDSLNPFEKDEKIFRKYVNDIFGPDIEFHSSEKRLEQFISTRKTNFWGPFKRILLIILNKKIVEDEKSGKRRKSEWTLYDNAVQIDSQEIRYTSSDEDQDIASIRWSDVDQLNFESDASYFLNFFNSKILSNFKQDPWQPIGLFRLRNRFTDKTLIEVAMLRPDIFTGQLEELRKRMVFRTQLKQNEQAAGSGSPLTIEDFVDSLGWDPGFKEQTKKIVSRYFGTHSKRSQDVLENFTPIPRDEAGNIVGFDPQAPTNFENTPKEE